MDVSDIINLVIGFLAIIVGILMFWSLPVPKADKHANLPFLSIIIPARNEENRITPPLLHSLQEQDFQSFEVLVIDDQSFDNTVTVAKAHGAKVIQKQGKDRESGKSMACWSGALHAKGKWLLFLDADTCFTDANSLRNLLLSYQQKGAKGILSLQPYHTVHKMYENLSAVFNTIVIVGMNIFTIWGRRFQTAGSFGPCILCNRDDYFLSGGHKKIQGAIMDDLALGQAFLNKDLPVYCLGGKGIISFRMYSEGFKSLVEGWCKSFAIASKSTHPIVMLLTIIWISGSFISAGMLLSFFTSADPVTMILSGLLYFLYAVQTAWFARRCGNFQWMIFIFYPILFLFFAAIYGYSLFRVNILHSVKWRGRNIDV
ncbi:4,4'-diaponeurosporenoate glycosyltransferase [Gracilibacillus boraciitolerans JCM 21714]|uniref:4,4'-diaponeurosporenoate glycosyltransferase n=1 Tax=Gracilibacillus boraciitolerans JCM 21714 TaxID=1298598 RepID=W4VIF9_9BACI|nr:glycosyltransferase [Gracilibacillus boraciitolerans]GAE92921.1 4,4'-diaponeurosporenoate glycosyltransferase [Gracilibacillus boraciitolerans JCM 21714]